MKSTEYEFDLEANERDWLRIRYSTDLGAVIIFTVQQETVVDNRRVAVVRYDCAHGFPHKDVLNPRGDVVMKEPLPRHLTMKDALDFAISDIKENWLIYRQLFLGEIS